jgi:hypothetical protein
MPDEIERQLEAFGETLAERTGEPIRAGSVRTLAAGRRPTRRWWALGGAAACLVAVVTGLALVAGRDDSAPPPAASEPVWQPLGWSAYCSPNALQPVPPQPGPYVTVEDAFAVAARLVGERVGVAAVVPPNDLVGDGAGQFWTPMVVDGGWAVALVRAEGDAFLLTAVTVCTDAGATAATTTTTTTTTLPVASLDARVGDDPLALARDGWTLEERDAGPFAFAPEELPCQVPMLELPAVEQVHDVMTTPEIEGLDVDVHILEVGSLDRGVLLTDAVLEIGECIEAEQGVTVEVTSLSSVRATWFRAGPDFALVAVVGEDDLSVVIEIEGHVFTDLLVADLAHRAAQFLAGQEVIGAPADTPVATTTLVVQDGPFVEPGPSVGEAQVDPEPGEVQLWVSNQSFEDDPVSITVRVDGIPVVGEPFSVEGQHNWQSFLIRGLAPGDHTVTAESDTGATSSWTFDLPADEPRWLVVDYWYYPDEAEGRHFTFQESDEPVAFA